MKKPALVLVALLAALGACSGDDGTGVEPENHAPALTFDFPKVATAISVPVQLSVAVSDADGDPITVTWSVSRGSITPLNGANTVVRWNVPATVGADTVTIQASDGTASSSVSSEIKVGWPFSGTQAPAVFLKSRSPYIVTVSSGVVLAITGGTTRIEAGTELLLETPATVIDVTDSLIAVSTISEPIVIRPNLRTLTCDDAGWWEGIKVYTDFPSHGYLELDYGELLFAGFAVRLRDQGSAVVRNSVIRCSQTGVRHEGGGVLLLEDTQVINSTLDGISLASGTLSPDSILVHGCTVSFNGRTGIALDDEFDPGENVPIWIEYTEIRFNVDHGITVANAAFPEIHYNTFFGNGSGTQFGLNHIWLLNGYPDVAFPTLNATCNFWGGPITNVATIEGYVRDSQDTGSVGTDVLVSPWSDVVPVESSPTCVVP